MYLLQKPEQLLEGFHYAIIDFDTIHVPGDERSRTNPGHGYPAEDVPITRYYVYEDKNEWEEAIIHRIRTGKTNFVCMDQGIRYNPKLKLELE